MRSGGRPACAPPGPAAVAQPPVPPVWAVTRPTAGMRAAPRVGAPPVPTFAGAALSLMRRSRSAGLTP